MSTYFWTATRQTTNMPENITHRHTQKEWDTLSARVCVAGRKWHKCTDGHATSVADFAPLIYWYKSYSALARYTRMAIVSGCRTVDRVTRGTVPLWLVSTKCRVRPIMAHRSTTSDVCVHSPTSTMLTTPSCSSEHQTSSLNLNANLRRSLPLKPLHSMIGSFMNCMRLSKWPNFPAGTRCSTMPPNAILCGYLDLFCGHIRGSWTHELVL